MNQNRHTRTIVVLTQSGITIETTVKSISSMLKRN